MAWSPSEFRRPLRSNNTLWAVISTCLFLAGWIVPFAWKDANEPLGLLWVVLFKHDYICPTVEILVPLAAITFVLGFISCLIGLLLQLLVCGLFDYGRTRRQGMLQEQEVSPENAS